jgi:transcriptional regulator with XRE-family HTH domain
VPPGVVDDQVAANIRRHREAAGLSQADLAAEMSRLGWPYHPQTVHRIEQGSRKVPVGEAAALAEILGVSLAGLTWPDPVSDTVAWFGLFTARADQAYEKIAEGTRDLLFAAAQLRRGIGEAEDRGLATQDDVREALEEARARIENATPARAQEHGRESYAEWAGEDRDVAPSWVTDGQVQVPMPPWEAP